jgi:hypothetical protein
MKSKSFKQKDRQAKRRKFFSQKSDAYELARRFRAEYPELTETQALTSAYLISGRSILEAKLKIEK